MLGDQQSSDFLRENSGFDLAAGPRTAITPHVNAYGNPWYEVSTEDTGIDMARYWRMLLKHRWLVAGCVIGALALGFGATMLMTPIYEADTTLKIDREADRIINVQGVQPPEVGNDSDEFRQTEFGLLKSRTLAAGVVDKLGLASGDNFFKAMGKHPPRGGLELRRRAAVDLFEKNLGVAPVRGSRLVKVSFNSPSAALAANLANAIAQEYITSNLSRRYESSDYAREFLEKKLVEVKAKLEASERAAADYASREKIINVTPVANESSEVAGTQSLANNSLVALNSGLAAARGERIKAEQRWRQSQSADAASLPEVLQNPTIQVLNQNRAKVAAEYQDKAKIYKPDFPDMVALRAQLAEMDRQLQQQMAAIQQSLKIQYDIALSQEKSFENQVQKSQSVSLDMGQRSIQYGFLQREADTNRTLYEGLLQRYKEIGVAGGISTNNISIIDQAEKPVKPSKPRPIVNMTLAGLAGLGLGLALALMLELLDESIATPEDLESKLNLSLLGSVPKLGRGETPLESLADSRSAFSEAYYSIRTALQFSTSQGAPSSMLITSSRPSEGKSTTSLAIAKNFARIGINVLLVDGDMRNPSMHRLLALDNSCGLSNVLTGSVPVSQAAVATNTPNLHFIPCGPLPPNPAELLAGERLRWFLGEALNHFGMVVIDGPPVLGLADAPTLAAAVAGTIFVIESRGTRRGLAKSAVQRLQMGKARLLGGILTKFDAKKASYGYGQGYSYAYEYSYGSKPKLTES